MTSEMAPDGEGGMPEAPAAPATRIATTLKSRNIRLDGRRTSIRLEDELWSALQAIADAEGATVNATVTAIAAREREKGTLTSAVRVFIFGRALAALRKQGGGQP